MMFQSQAASKPPQAKDHRPEEKTRMQSLKDFIVFGTMALGSPETAVAARFGASRVVTAGLLLTGLLPWV